MASKQEKQDMAHAYKQTFKMLFCDGGCDDIAGMCETPITMAAFILELHKVFQEEYRLPEMNFGVAWGLAFGIHDAIIQLENKIPPTFANLEEAVDRVRHPERYSQEVSQDENN